MANNAEIAQNVMNAIGGTKNVTSVTHCMTRLRFVLKDETIPSDEKVKNIQGVLSLVRNGGQYQVVIGPNVQKVYEEVCRIGGFTQKEAVKEESVAEHSAEKKKLTPKEVGKNIIGYMGGCMTPMIPVMLAGGLFSCINAIFGPGLLKLYGEGSDMQVLFQFLYNAAYYFMPILVGFNAAKLLDINQMLGAYMGCILIAPELISIVDSGEPFAVFGIPCTLNNYSQTVLPIMLSVYAMSLIYKVVKKYMPDFLTTVFTPFLTMLISTPIALCILAPLGSIAGNAISGSLAAFGNATGFFGVAVIAAIWELLVMTGMHMALMMPMMASFFETGVMSGPLVSGNFATWACFGVALGAALRLKKREDKSTAFGFFISGIVGGITEPVLYGLCLRYNRLFLSMAAGGFVGGAYAGITNLCGYSITSPNFLTLLSYAGGTTANLVNGVIGSVLAFAVATIMTYLIGFSKKDLEET